MRKFRSPRGGAFLWLVLSVGYGGSIGFNRRAAGKCHDTKNDGAGLIRPRESHGTAGDEKPEKKKP